MRKVFVRARRVLLLAAALAVAAALSGGTAHAATTAASSTPCSFNPATSPCQSTDATVTLNSHYSGTSACTFTWHIDWADGSSSDVTDTNPADGYLFLAQHTYAKAGTYHITVTGQVVAGDCTATGGNYYFTLVKPTAPPVTAFSIRGNHPVQPGNDRDTHAQTPQATCSTPTYVKDEAIAKTLIESWSVLGLDASAELMQHFLSGTGTEIDFDVSSATAQETSEDGVFEQLNKNVQANVLAQLEKGVSTITVSSSLLAPPKLGDNNNDLKYAFRGTQGVTVTGRGTLQNGRYVGDLLYKITDTYGFKSPSDLTDGSQMRYLQTNCGAPYKKGGAHWFQDTITVVVPFSQPA